MNSKTNWQLEEVVMPEDMNRIEGNIKKIIDNCYEKTPINTEFKNIEDFISSVQSDSIKKGDEILINGKFYLFLGNSPKDKNNYISYGGPIENENVIFREAEEKKEILSGDSIGIIFGKIKKIFHDLKVIAFSGDYEDLLNKPTIPSSLKNPYSYCANGKFYDGSKIVDMGTLNIDYGGTGATTAETARTNLGLDKVPNVATNDQTPTFTAASTRANIASGEKLSVIFGKIAKYFTDLKTVAFTGSYSDLTNKPTIPSTLKNPYSLKTNGKTYDGSAAIDMGTVGLAYGGTGATTAETARTNLGLDKVPNVATNDQTPTFTAAGTRANIASGEKLSVIFGKIAKYFADLKTVAFTGSYSDLSNKPTALKNPNALKANGKTYDGSTAVDIGTVGLAYGGTGATTAAAARTNLGLGTAATQGVANNLITTAAGYALDARQGKALKDEINTLNGSLSSLIHIKSQSVSVGTIGTLSDYNSSVNCDIPSGYVPAGILGWQIGGNFCSWIILSKIMIQNNKIYYILHNTASESANNIDITFVVLYARI